MRKNYPCLKEKPIFEASIDIICNHSLTDLRIFTEIGSGSA